MLKVYASYFVSFLLGNLKKIETIERIVLFGSVARDEARKDSDIDIFIEVKKNPKKIVNDIFEIEKKFYESREANLFKSRGVDNKISIKIGKLSEWKDLYKSIASTGIVLYGPYEAKDLPSGVNHNIIIFWTNIGKNRGSFLNKLYGYRIKEKKYLGLIEKFGGKKIGKSCVMIPIQFKKEFYKLIEAHKVEAKIIDVFS